MALSRLQASRFAPWLGLVTALGGEGLHHQVLSDMLRFDCRLGDPLKGMLAAVAVLVVMGLGAWFSWESVRGKDVETAQDATRRFIARLSVMTAALLAVAVVWQTLATVVVPPCPP
jgi:hypothetical protein